MRKASQRAARLAAGTDAAQFTLLVAINALVGALVGQERTILSLLATDVFGLHAATAALSFVFAFGLTKAVTNLVAGSLADRHGRKPVLVAGWLVGIPVPILLAWAPAWEWVLVANLLLGLNQGLTWSMTAAMKIDLVGQTRRGFAMGMNEGAGYLALALLALVTGYLAEEYGLRPVPFLLGTAIAAAGLGASVLLVDETSAKGSTEWARAGSERRNWLAVLQATLRDRRMTAASQAGLVTNLKDGMAWGLLPLYYAAGGLGVGEIGLLAAAYPATWGVLQFITGASSDRLGRKPLIVAGMLLQAVAMGLIAAMSGFHAWLVASILLGVATALVYPTLMAAVADAAAPAWRAQALGTYRFWRDGGFVVGALTVGVLADRAGMPMAIGVVAGLAALSGSIVWWGMQETHAPGRGQSPSAASSGH